MPRVIRVSARKMVAMEEETPGTTTYTLTFEVGTEGAGTITNEETEELIETLTVEEGTTITISEDDPSILIIGDVNVWAGAEGGYSFDAWLIGDEALEDGMEVTEDLTITATYIED